VASGKSKVGVGDRVAVGVRVGVGESVGVGVLVGLDVEVEVEVGSGVEVAVFEGDGGGLGEEVSRGVSGSRAGVHAPRLNTAPNRTTQ
jgi:hypothetical protein